MSNGKCQKCGKSIDPKYKYCLDCIDRYKGDDIGKGEDKSSNLDDVVDKINKLNWNLGKATIYLKLFLISNLEKDEKIKKKIYKALAKDLDKDLKVLRDIKTDEQANI